jgi:tetratricopeptide (TPR) repeat protein
MILLKKTRNYFILRVKKELNFIFGTIFFFSCSGVSYDKVAEENPLFLIDIQDSLINNNKSKNIYDALKKANNNLGKQEFEKEEFDKAIFYFSKAIELDKDDTLANFHLLICEGNKFYKTGKNDNLWSAILKYNKAAQINPKSGIPYYYIGLSYQKIGDKDFDLILEAFQNALLLELDDNTRKKTQSLLEATKKREKLLKDFWH